MRTISVPPTAQRVLWFVFNAGAPVIVLSAVVLLPILTGATSPSGATASQGLEISPHSLATAGAVNSIRVSRLLGSAVFGPDRKLVGTVNDVLLGKGGTITAVTLDVGAFLGVHTRTVAVPIDRLRLVSANEVSASIMPSPTVVSRAGDEGSATIMEDLMYGNERAWQVGAVDHIEGSLSRKELANLPSYAGD